MPVPVAVWAHKSDSAGRRDKSPCGPALGKACARHKDTQMARRSSNVARRVRDEEHESRGDELLGLISWRAKIWKRGLGASSFRFSRRGPQVLVADTRVLLLVGNLRHNRRHNRATPGENNLPTATMRACAGQGSAVNALLAVIYGLIVSPRGFVVLPQTPPDRQLTGRSPVLAAGSGNRGPGGRLPGWFRLP